jgi:hypothetical protein
MMGPFFFVNLFAYIQKKCNLYEYSDRWKIKLDAFDSSFFLAFFGSSSWNSSKVKSKI